nr:response regulator [Pedobacter ginsengisoli]
MKILLIEDESSLRESIITYFTDEGNICETAVDYRSAIEKINIYSYDCILLDLTLPGVMEWRFCVPSKKSIKKMEYLLFLQGTRLMISLMD